MQRFFRIAGLLGGSLFLLLFVGFWTTVGIVAFVDWRKSVAEEARRHAEARVRSRLDEDPALRAIIDRRAHELYPGDRVIDVAFDMDGRSVNRGVVHSTSPREVADYMIFFLDQWRGGRLVEPSPADARALLEAAVRACRAERLDAEARRYAEALARLDGQ
jgi:hypothetical protein